MFVDVHSHVVPSGDDGAQSLDEGRALCATAAEHGTVVLFATPHVWPENGLSRRREEAVRDAHTLLAAEARMLGLDLRLGFELTPSRRLLEEDPRRFRLGGLPYVLMELPFVGELELARRLAEHVEEAGLTPVIAHPERAEAVHEDPDLVYAFAERWPIQLNGSSFLGHHGPACEELAFRFLDEGLVGLVASDGHRTSRPAVLDPAYRVVRGTVGKERAGPLFDGSAIGVELPARDGLDVAQRRQPV
jgi:protein-tyrosine phosphatase